jgi:YVTN family beta-propeller protein
MRSLKVVVVLDFATPGRAAHTMNFTLHTIATVLSSLLLLAAVGAGPADEHSPSGWLLVANKGDHTLGIIDPASGHQVVTIPVEGVTGHEVAASPDGKTAFVPIYGNSGVGFPGTDGSSITAIDLQSRKVVAKIELSHGLRPHCAIFGPKNGLLYVTTELDNDIQVIDPHTFKILGTVPTGQPESHMLAISSDGKRGYTANVGPGTVSAIDLVAGKVIAIIPVAHTAQRISLSADDRWIFTADQDQPRLAVIDASTNTLKNWVALPAVAYGTAATRDGKWLLITQPSTSKVVVLDLSSMKIVRAIDVLPAPQEILVRPDGKRAYVSCDRSGKVAILNLENWQMEGTIDAGKGVDGLAWAVRQ